MNAKEIPIQKWPCSISSCGSLCDSEAEAERHCERGNPSPVWTCSVCWIETFDQFESIEDCQRHIQEEHGSPGSTLEDQYLEDLRFKGFVGGQALYEFEANAL